MSSFWNQMRNWGAQAIPASTNDVSSMYAPMDRLRIDFSKLIAEGAIDDLGIVAVQALSQLDDADKLTLLEFNKSGRISIYQEIENMTQAGYGSDSIPLKRMLQQRQSHEAALNAEANKGFSIGDIDPFDTGTELTYNMQVAGHDVPQVDGAAILAEIEEMPYFEMWQYFPDAAEPLKELEAAIARNDGPEVAALAAEIKEVGKRLTPQALGGEAQQGEEEEAGGGEEEEAGGVGGGEEEAGAGVSPVLDEDGTVMQRTEVTWHTDDQYDPGDIDLNDTDAWAGDEAGAIEMTELRNQTNELMRQTVALGEEAGAFGIQPFRQQDIAVGPKGEFWITQQGLRNWVAANSQGFVVSNVVVAPILAALDRMTGNQGFSTYINTGINLIGMLTMGDPTGILFQAATTLYSAIQESKRRAKENLTPGKDRGKKLGYVRQGDKWVPAVFSTHFEDTGLFAKGGTVNAQFGDTVLYTAGMATYGAEGSVQPIVINKDGSPIGHRAFRIDDDDYTNKVPDKFGDMYGRTATWARQAARASCRGA